MICYVNGLYTDDPKISGFDLGVLRGLGIFDYFITYDRTPFHFSDHFLRLKKNAEKVRIKLPHTEKEVRAIVDELMQQNPNGELAFRMVLTAGSKRESHFMILVTEIDRPDPTYYQTGVKLQTAIIPRVYPDIKSLFYMPAILALNEAQTMGFFEVLGKTEAGQILEASTANFFAYLDGKLLTPAQGVLPGITRKIIKNLSPVCEKALHIEDIPRFEEAFLSSTNKEILPVVQIDNQIIGDGRPGPRTKQLHEAYQKSIRPLIVSP
ncbi:MAG: aminotransferase class IV [Candidatus Algichlamydia australiensis]|nr:aminotransferase class IV [Chlamydiales bacterium]